MAETTLVERDLSKSLKAKYVDLPKMPVSVGLTMDAALEKLARSGKESFRLQQLADAGNAAIDKWVGAFQSSIDSVERKLPALGPKEAKEKIAELSDVLVKYSKQLEPTVDKAIEAEWKAICARNKALTVYKIKSRLKISIAVLTAGANVLSLFATAGADVMSAVSLVNVVANLAAQYHRESMEIFKHHERLGDMMVSLDDTVRSDVIGGFKETAKGLAADLSPVLGRFVKSTKAAEIELESLRRKFVSAEKDADNVVGEMNKARAKIEKLGRDGIDAKVYAQIEVLQGQIDKLLKELVESRKLLREAESDLDDWEAALAAWNRQNPFKAAIKTAGTGAKNASLVGGVVATTLKTISVLKALL